MAASPASDVAVMLDDQDETGTEDFVDSVEAIRSYFGLSIVDDNKNLVRVKFRKHSPVARRVFVVIAATQRILGTRDFKIAQTPAGVIYVSTFGEHLAWVLDGQKSMDFGTEIQFNRVPDIVCEPRLARGSSAAFKAWSYAT